MDILLYRLYQSHQTLFTPHPKLQLFNCLETSLLSSPLRSCSILPLLSCFHPHFPLQFVKSNTADLAVCEGTKDWTDCGDLFPAGLCAFNSYLKCLSQWDLTIPNLGYSRALVISTLGALHPGISTLELRGCFLLCWATPSPFSSRTWRPLEMHYSSLPVRILPKEKG